MKWLGVWILSWVVWLVIIAGHGEVKDRQGIKFNASKSKKDLMFWWMMTGIIMLGIWCIRQ